MITVQTTGSVEARNSVNSLMEDHRGKWRLLGTEEKDGIITLEYLGRLPRKRSPPLQFLERLRTADPDVKHVGFRSLRKMLADKVEVGDAMPKFEGKPPNAFIPAPPKVSDDKDSKSNERKGE